jgi:hypothetical protein
MMNLLLEIKSIVSNKEENNMIRLLKEEIRMMKEKEKDEMKGLKKEIELLKEAHSIEIKMLKAKFQEEKKEVKEVKEVVNKEVKEVVKQEKKEVVKEEKKEEEDKSMFDKYPNGVIHIGGLTYTQMKAIKADFLKTKEFKPSKEFKNTPENIRRVRLYLGLSVKPIEEKKEDPQPEPEPQPEPKDEEDEEDTDEDKAFGEYCDKDEYGVYHIGGIQSDSLTRLKDFYTNKIPKDLLYGERKTKCNDKMDYLKREFSSKFSNEFSGSKDDFNKLKFYLEN